MKLFLTLLIALAAAAGCKDKDKPAPAKIEPAKAEPAKTEPAKAEPAKTEPDEGPKEPAKVAAPKPDVDKAVTGTLALADKMAKAVADAGKDCAKFGESLKALEAEAKAVAVTERDLDQDPEADGEYNDKLKRSGRAGGDQEKTLKEAFTRCAKDPNVQAHMDAMVSVRNGTER